MYIGVLWILAVGRVDSVILTDYFRIGSSDSLEVAVGSLSYLPLKSRHSEQYVLISWGKPSSLSVIRAVMAFLTVRRDAPGPLFLPSNGQPLSRASLTDWLRQTQYTDFLSHSFRTGSATNGALHHLIQALGLGQSSSYHLYIRTSSEALTALLSTFGR